MVRTGERQPLAENRHGLGLQPGAWRIQQFMLTMEFQKIYENGRVFTYFAYFANCPF